VNLPAFLLSKSLVPDSLGGLDLRRSILLAEDRAIFSNDCRQKRPIKYKTRVERRAQPPCVLAASREAQLVLTRANKAPHYRICSLDYFRPDCESPARPDTLGSTEPFVILPNSGICQAFHKTFFRSLPHPLWKLWETTGPWKGVWLRASAEIVWNVCGHGAEAV